MYIYNICKYIYTYEYTYACICITYTVLLTIERILN